MENKYLKEASKQSIIDLLPDHRKRYMIGIWDTVDVYLFGAFLDAEEQKEYNLEEEELLDTLSMEYDGIKKGLVSYCVYYRYKAAKHNGIYLFAKTIDKLQSIGIATRLSKFATAKMGFFGCNTMTTTYDLEKESNTFMENLGFVSKNNRKTLIYDVESLKDSRFGKKALQLSEKAKDVKRVGDLTQDEFQKYRMKLLTTDKGFDLEKCDGRYSYVCVSKDVLMGYLIFTEGSSNNLILIGRYFNSTVKNNMALPLILSKVIRDVMNKDMNIKKLVLYFTSAAHVESIIDLLGEPMEMHADGLMTL